MVPLCMLRKLSLLLTGLFLFLNSFNTHAQDIFDSSRLHEIRITFTQDTWFDILSQYYEESNFTDDKKTLKAKIQVDAISLPEDISIRFKGVYSYQGFPGKKKPFRLNVSKYDKAQTLNGTKKFNLHNLAGDPSFLREFIAYDFLRYQGIPASRTAFTKLYINDSYWGCYLIVEEPEDDFFLQQNFNTDKGNLFEADTTTQLAWNGEQAKDYPEIKLQTKEQAGSWKALIHWLDLINNNYQYNFQQELNNRFDVPGFLKALSTDIFIDNWDSYAANGRNFFIYENPLTQKLSWIPWDYNLSFWEKNLPPFPQNDNHKMRPLIWRFYENSYLKSQYLKSICALISEAAVHYPLAQKIERAQNLIKEAVAADPNKFYTYEEFLDNAYKAVTVKMLRGGALKDIYLPGITEHWKKRKNNLRKEAMSLGCDCDAINTNKETLILDIFPNPVADRIGIYVENDIHQLDCRIMSTNAQTVKSATVSLSNGLAHIDCTGLPAGYYLIRFSDTTLQKTIPFIKQ